MKRSKIVVGVVIFLVFSSYVVSIFTDTAISRGNSIETAEFDVAISKNGKRFYNELKLFEMNNLLPGETRKSEFQIKNRGTVEVKKLTITFKVRNYEVRMSPSEKAVDSTPETGELGKWLVLKSIHVKGKSIIVNQTLNALNGKTITLPVTLQPGEIAGIEMTFELPDETGNECQTDGIDITLRLDASQ
ncbi:TasA family protein [Thermococcus sp.]|uniref:TasA family protein n=1 Tax=Thermococcus sp. TaxID=35749 RepID=UPI00260B7B0D|nr:TasA family protein [Thermococcus sp.]